MARIHHNDGMPHFLGFWCKGSHHSEKMYIIVLDNVLNALNCPNSMFFKPFLVVKGKLKFMAN
jgi:hypothetical protein